VFEAGALLKFEANLKGKFHRVSASLLFENNFNLTSCIYFVACSIS